MRPSGVVLSLRRKVGCATLLRTARSPWSKQINVQAVTKPSAEDIQMAVSKRKSGQRKQRENLLSSLQQALSSPPKHFRLHTSPMPISPSYRSKVSHVIVMCCSCELCDLQVPKSKPNVVTTAGTFIPSASNPLVPTPQPALVTHISSTSGAQQQVSTAGTFVPPGNIHHHL